MKKFECVRNLFSQLLSREYKPIIVDLSDKWQLKAIPGTSTINQAKPYLGTMPIQVEFYSGGERKITWELTLHCYQSALVRSLEDDEGGYVFLIRSSKSELLFRAMQAAKYTPNDEGMLVTITADLNSKKGDTEFTEHMREALNHFAPALEEMGGRILKPHQIALIDYDSIRNAIIQSSQQVLSSTTLFVTLKALYKGELKLQ
ncbi:hypothetical protein E5161_10055 [Cohnella pontilimi]|uniref:Uncharacterized protein n=1 Tax=Cohnella pontilimi TaxID=2564100 RepID=A0A4U0FC77_9BACL|nr:hypothetical protein [Cohnella pontilimi]TJY42330.1 hypothetical protein E5161_10055 [Cohnella pontilimi]